MNSQTKEADGPLKEVFDSLCVLPRDIEMLCPRIGEPVYVDVDGNGHYKTMTLASITPRYLTFRIVSPITRIGWIEFKVCRRRTGLGFTFVLSRGWGGALYCRLHKVEESATRKNQQTQENT